MKNRKQDQSVFSSMQGLSPGRSRRGGGGHNQNFEEPFDPKKFVAVGVTERDVEMYKEVFDMFDVQNCGT